MRVESLAPVTKTRFRAVLDDGSGLVFSKREMEQWEIREGAEIEEAVWREILAEQRRQCLAKCGALLADSDYSEKGLLDKLLRAGFPEEVARRCVQDMVDARYVDEARFAESFARQHLRDRSLKRIRFDLENKGVRASVIEEAMASLEEEEDLEAAQTAQARRLLEKRRYPFGEADYARRQKEAAYLSGKGFSADVIRRAMAAEETDE